MVRFRLLFALVGISLVAVSGVSVTQATRELSQYRELVHTLESQPSEPERPRAALDHARRSLTFLESRDAARWSVGGYMFAGTAWALLGVGLLTFGLRRRTA